jgi:hypothetical protein
MEDGSKRVQLVWIARLISTSFRSKWRINEMFCVVNEDMRSNNFYRIWTKISFLEHSDIFLSFRKGSANQFIDERYLLYFGPHYIIIRYPRFSIITHEQDHHHFFRHFLFVSFISPRSSQNVYLLCLVYSFSR